MLRRSWRRFDLAHLKDTQQILSESNAKLSALVVDYVREAAEVHKVKFHAPMLVGAREDGMRGMYLAPHHKVEKNQPLFTVPYSGLITNESIMKATEAPRDLTLPAFEKVWPDDELKPLLPAVHLATHIAYQMDRLPRRTGPIADRAAKDIAQGLTEENSESIRDYMRLLSVHTSEIMPWCRMLDDEDWNEEHIGNLYKGALDQFQSANYDDLTKRYSKALTATHVALNLDVKLDTVRRLSRIVLARFESVPMESDLGHSPMKRRFVRLYRMLAKEKPKRVNVIVPFLEMINHSGRPNVGIRFGVFDGVPAIRAFSMNRIEGGAELCRYYNFSMDKGNALFRFGFLPFEVVSVPEMNQWKEHYVDGIYPNLGDKSEEERRREEEIQKEVTRLQKVFEDAKSRS